MNHLTYKPFDALSQRVPFTTLAVLFLMVFDEVFSMSMSSDGQERTIIYIFRFSMILVYLWYILLLNDFFMRRLRPLEMILVFFTLWSLFSAVMISPNKFLALMEVLRYIYWTLAFSFVYTVVRRYPQTVQYICFYFALSIIFYLWFTVTKSNEMIDLRGERTTGINSSYCLVFTYPWLLIYRRKLVKFLGMLAVCGGVIVSYKRGAVLVLFIAFCMTGFSGILIYRGKKLFRWVTTIVFIGIILTLLVLCLNLSFGLAAGYSYRMQDVQEGSFSGRREINEGLFNNISNSSYFETICGRGLFSTVQETGGAWAHNDWLESLFSLGIIGLVIFTLIHFCILVLLFRLLKSKTEYFIPCFTGYTIFFCRTLTAGWLHYTSFSYFLALIAVAYALSERGCLDNFFDDRYRIPGR